VLRFYILDLHTLGFYGAVPADEERFQVLDRAYELGALNWDSADMYGDNEDLLGKWFKRTGKRDEVSSSPESSQLQSRLTPD
jgi:aryl-alcohol dehydrogenase-like predicted oxidoreductase